MRFLIASSLTVAFALVALSFARAQSMYGYPQSPQGTSPPSQAASIDSNFVMQAAKLGVEEVRQGQIQQTSLDLNARSFAKQMLNDFSVDNQQLATLASQTGTGGVLLPAISNAKAPDFSSPQAYLNGEVAAHRNAIALFRLEAKKGQNPQLRSFAQQMLPQLRRELELAERSLTP